MDLHTVPIVHRQNFFRVEDTMYVYVCKLFSFKLMNCRGKLLRKRSDRETSYFKYQNSLVTNVDEKEVYRTNS